MNIFIEIQQFVLIPSIKIFRGFAMFSFNPNRELSALNMCLEPRQEAIKGNNLDMNVKRIPSNK